MSKIAIIIPCYNELKRLKTENILNFLSQHSEAKFVFVNDGSRDATKDILENIMNLYPDNIVVLNNSKRKGKAESIRIGLTESLKDPDITYHGFIDADLAVSLEEFYRLYNILSASNRQFIFGSRIKKIGSVITRNEWRHFYSRFIATFVGFITKFDVYDTQCSAKLFRAEILPVLIKEPFRTKWLFDVELISRLSTEIGDINTKGYEEPLLKWTEIKGSKLRWYNIFQIFKEIAILYKYYRKK